MTPSISSPKIILICTLTLETLLITALGIQNVTKSKENTAILLQIKEKEGELLEIDSAMKELSAEAGELKRTRGELESKAKDLLGTKKVLEAKVAGMKTATDTFSLQFERQQKEMLSRIGTLTSQSKEILDSFLSKMQTLVSSREFQGSAPGAPDGASSADVSAASGVALEKIVVQKNAPAGNDNEGTILNIDDKYHLAIVDLGVENGVKPGMRYSVLRGERKIGEVIVREVYRGMSIAEAIDSAPTASIRQGDRIVKL